MGILCLQQVLCRWGLLCVQQEQINGAFCKFFASCDCRREVAHRACCECSKEVVYKTFCTFSKYEADGACNRYILHPIVLAVLACCACSRYIACGACWPLAHSIHRKDMTLACVRCGADRLSVLAAGTRQIGSDLEIGTGQIGPADLEIGIAVLEIGTGQTGHAVFEIVTGQMGHTVLEIGS